MARALRIQIPGSNYHVTCRGNERKAIYRDDTDRQAFLTKLQDSLRIYQVELHAYVLMDNHFHLMVRTVRGNLSEFMRHFNISYTAAFNRRHRRVGHLYQGRYKAILVDRDSYLLELSRYVHLNPVRLASQRTRPLQEQLRLLERYRWSSLGGYWEANNKQPFITYHSVLEQIGQSRTKYREFVIEGIKSGYATPWDRVQGQVVLGEAKFVERVREEVEGKGSKREQPGIGEIQARSPVAVLRAVARYYGVEQKQLVGKRTGLRDERAVAMELVYRHGRVGQVQIGVQFGGLDYTAVSRERKRLRDKVEQDARLRKAMTEIENGLMSKVKI
jgi:REP element-mobilizing transposase RayT